MYIQGQKRVIFDNIQPQAGHGSFAVKRCKGEEVAVQADIFADGHDIISAQLLWRHEHDRDWNQTALEPLVNDRWQGSFLVQEAGYYYYTLKAWIDHFRTWQLDLDKKFSAGQDIKVELLIGAELIESAAQRARKKDREELLQRANALKNQDEDRAAVVLALSQELTRLMLPYPEAHTLSALETEIPVYVDRPRAGFSAWYEFFPRSASNDSQRHGTFKDCLQFLPEIARMGFDVVYFPPIHPIGRTNRKGKNNTPQAQKGDPGSPWAIGSHEGGHKSIHPQLGSLEDFKELIAKAAEHDLEIALDLALQCSVDHPYVREHPEWFNWRPDGSIRHAENPPKKYEDIVPLNFETEHWQELWEELKSIVLFWIEQGVRIFRVDNPHTKPLPFWQWLIGQVKTEYPEVLFLSEAFTRPKVMYHLAKIGFSQSYTYFTWRNTKWELTEYIQELTQTEVKDFFRPNFWPNTPDILPEFLQYGERPAFIIRLILAATLSSNYGIYGPAFELCEDRAIPGREEYLDSEKFELKNWDWNKSGNLRELISRINAIRRENKALQSTNNIEFYETDNDYVLFYAKFSADGQNIILVAVNLDPFHSQRANVHIPLQKLQIAPKQPYLLHDLLGQEKYIWQGHWNSITLNPHIMPAQIFLLHRKMRREADFDYFM
jgi:starch synthase (maltosyl-transferring)